MEARRQEKTTSTGVPDLEQNTSAHGQGLKAAAHVMASWSCMCAQEGSVASLLPGSSSNADDTHWQPSSAHSPASTVSTAVSPILWQAAIATVPPASAPVPTPFQVDLHRPSSLQLNLGDKASMILSMTYIPQKIFWLQYPRALGNLSPSHLLCSMQHRCKRLC